MFDLEMNFSRNFERQQESFDEGILQIAGITVNDNTVIVNPITVNLNQQVPFDYTDAWPDHFGTLRNPVQIATVTPSNPYFAFVIRAIECDNSNDNRPGDLDRFIENIRVAAQSVVDGGGLPVHNTIWEAGRSAPLKDRVWRDDDDNIGSSARVYRDYGVILARRNEVIDPPVAGTTIPGSTRHEELFFNADGAAWRVRVNLYAKWS